ncbi:type VI secretion system tip protein VgrG (plasmid) [Hafnia alvei]|uniref:type VI secretion system Vgr family protein n=1 Tax=Hafnia alvei TaxID=569 RepID=UPI000B70C492|nr:type VI secretion system tip protein TssI/VgrG [Hafnia alvei]MBI0278601.1 type VI secretion system tip protein VgrG [Hafnia alvei]PNL03896.1 type VI secretion system tip protein VgrG [Hafnia alvei]
MPDVLGQDKRFIRFSGDAAYSLTLMSINGEESFSSIYRYQIQFRTTLTSAQMGSFFGKEVACEVGNGNQQRYIHGVLTHIIEDNNTDGLSTFTGTLEPRLALLRLGRNLAVFQNITVPDLVCKLLRQQNINHIELRLRAIYEPREYCIQYRESDFVFISRLLEQEGIYYFFVHDAGQHTLVLADHPSSHQTGSPATLPFIPQAGEGDGTGISSWAAHSTLTASSVLLKGFNMEQAAGVEGASKAISPDYTFQSVNYVDIHGNDKRDQLQAQARLKMEQLEADNQQFMAQSSAFWLGCGMKFTFSDHPSCHGDYRIKAVSLYAASSIDSAEPNINCMFTVLNDSVSWRPPYLFPQPEIAGVLTATVVGPKSEEIHTDEYGRIKIQFPWDSENKHDDGSSCWVRVSQPWAGGRFGAMFLPRVTHEVIVSFVYGNPDYPLVTGTVFNGQNKPPLSLPDGKNYSGFVSRSSLGGSVEDGHQLCFDDKKDEEKLSITSQRDLLLTVKNDVITEIAKKVTETIGEDRSTEITKGKETLTLKQGDRILTLEQGNHSISLKQGDYNIDIKGNLETSLNGGDRQLKISGGGSLVKADKACVIESTQSIELKVGSSKISISPSGITLSGTTIKIEGSGSAELKGAMVTVQGSGMTQIKGGVTTIG